MRHDYNPEDKHTLREKIVTAVMVAVLIALLCVGIYVKEAREAAREPQPAPSTAATVEPYDAAAPELEDVYYDSSDD